MSRDRTVRVPSAILFDMDGVLVDSYQAWFHLLRAASAELGGPGVTPERFASTWGQGVEADVGAFFPAATSEAVERFYLEHFAEHAHHVVVNAEAPAVLALLRQTGVPVAVVSNTPTALAQTTIEKAGLTVEYVLGAGGVLFPKPAPDLLLSACARLGVSPGDAVMVGDSRFDREAASRAGIFFVGYGGITGDWTIGNLNRVVDLARGGVEGGGHDDVGN